MSSLPSMESLILMNTLHVDHIALFVESLRQAENLYSRLFGLEVLFREGSTEEGWLRRNTGSAEEEPLSEDWLPERSCLDRDGFRLLLILGSDEFAANGRIHHVCLSVSVSELERISQQVEKLGCQVMQQRPQSLILDDPYGIRWEVTAGDC